MKRYQLECTSANIGSLDAMFCVNQSTTTTVQNKEKSRNPSHHYSTAGWNALKEFEIVTQNKIPYVKL